MESTKNKYYELPISAPTSFNIHLERKYGGFIGLYRRTSGEGWDLVASLPQWKSVIDTDVYVPIGTEFKLVVEGEPFFHKITFASGGGSDAPEGYGNFITADDMVFAASDSKFYVEL